LVDIGKLLVSATNTAPSALVTDELMKDSSIVAVPVDER
jgi:hypothetical protein